MDVDSISTLDDDPHLAAVCPAVSLLARREATALFRVRWMGVPA